MVNPLNIILPFLFTKRGVEARIDHEKAYKKTEEFACTLLTLQPAPDNLADQIWELAGRLSIATALNRGEAADCIMGWIKNKVDRGIPTEEAMREVVTYATATYLTRPLGVFDKRPDVDMKGGGG